MRPDILQTNEDYANWDKLIIHCDSLEGFSDEEKEMAKEAFRFLRKELGETFLIESLKKPNELINNIRNLAPWTRRWMIWFADALKELKKETSYSKLLKRLTDHSKFQEAFSVSEIAYAFRKNGFSVEFDPTTPVNDKKKMPDLKVVNLSNGEELFVEVRIIGEGNRDKEINETFHAFVEPMWMKYRGLHFAGRIFKVLSRPRINELLEKIDEMSTDVDRNGGLREFKENRVLEIAVTRQTDRNLIEIWSRAHGYGGEVTFIGPPIDTNEMIRTRLGIIEEQEHFPKDRAGIIVLRHNNLLFRTRRKYVIADDLEETLYGYDHILSVVISNEHVGAGENVHEQFREHSYTCKRWLQFMVTESVVLTNRFCRIQLSDDTRDKVQKVLQMDHLQ